MSNIRILPENLANQIAAGEVIERPASVVKELVENAIDAGATQISVQVEGNGTRLIRVIDNGIGMDQDDLLLSLERHATSKIRSIEELGAIRSLGFRGEALPSIASVSRLRITSRLKGQPLGAQVDVRFGRLVKVHDMGCSPGTTFEISDLFGNVPARKKFLKTAKTELSHVEEVIKNYALVTPDLGVSYTVNGKEVWQVPAAVDTPRQRAERMVGRGAVSLIEISGNEKGMGDDGQIIIAGYLVPPDAVVAASARLRSFVNGRMVRDRMINHAVGEGLQNYLMKGHRPVGVFFISVHPGTVDVNVHPTKQEVRFHNSSLVHDAISRAVSQAMAGYQRELKGEIFTPSSVQNDGGADHSAYPLNDAPVGFAVAESVALFKSKKDVRANSCYIPQKSAPVSQLPDEDNKPEDISGICISPSSSGEDVSVGSAVDLVKGEAAVGPLHYIGQVLATYLLCESDQGLLVIDQHAAHERLLFEKLKKQFVARKVSRQALLFPKVIECSLEEVGVLQRYSEDIEALGLDLQDFGDNSYVIKAVPAILGKSSPEEIMAGIFARFSKEASAKGGVRAEGVLADMACKSAIKAGQQLSAKEAEALLEQMIAADIFSHCPHGRPVVKRFSELDIKKWFYRG